MAEFIDRPKYACALGGAIATINALPRAVPILHSGPGCGLNLSFAINGGGAYYGSGYCGGLALPSTNVLERDIVFGGEERLLTQIEKTIEIIDADLYIVVSACMVEIIGDDITSAAKRFNCATTRVLATETAGFKGNSYLGYDLILQTLFKDFVEQQGEKDSKTVNLFGIVPIQDVFWKGNLRILKSLLQELGLKVNTFFGEDETLDNLKYSAKASLNIVLSENYGIKAAEVFESVHHTPYISLPLPIGAGATDHFIDSITYALHLDTAQAESLKVHNKHRYYDYMVRIADLYNDFDMQRYAIIVSDSNYAPALTRFVADDLGWLPEVVVIHDPLKADQQTKVNRQFENIQSSVAPEIIFDSNEGMLMSHIKNHWSIDDNPNYYDSLSPAIIIGSTFELDLATDLKLPLLPVTYPITNRVVLSRGYVGYEGGLTLTEDLFSTLVGSR